MLRRQKRKRVAVAAVAEDDEWDTSVDLIDDTMASVQLLLNRNADGFAALGLPPLVVWHQLYVLNCYTRICVVPHSVSNLQIHHSTEPHIRGPECNYISIATIDEHIQLIDFSFAVFCRCIDCGPEASW